MLHCDNKNHIFAQEIKLLYLSMRNLKLSTLNLKLTAIFAVMLSVALFSVGCSETPVDETPKTTTVELAETSVAVAAEGGECSVGYTIANGISGIDIVAKSDAEWITNISTAEQVLKFHVAQNSLNEERVARIIVKYPAIDDVELVVKQAAFEGVTFQIEITDKTTTTCKTTITPSDPDALYIAYMADLSYFYQAGITTAEQLFEDDYNYFMGFAEQFDAPYLEEFLLANEVAFKGETTITWTQMTPDTEYVIYVYAIDVNDANDDYSLASPISHKMFSLSANDLAEVKFDVVVDINGPEATYHITPVDWEGKYYLDIYEESEWMYRPEGTELDDDYARVVSNTWMSLISMYMQSGYSAEQLIELMCLEGEESYSEVRKASTNYAMILYAIEMVDGLPQVVSKPQLVNFRTGDVLQSDMQLDIQVTNNYVRVADIAVTPSYNDVPYTVALIATEEVPEGDDNVIIQWMTDNFQLDIFKGSIFSHLNTLKPDTEYSVLAFGYYGGEVTTPLFRKDFTTEPEGECLNSIVSVTWDAPYSLAELEARFPDKYFNYGMFESMGWYAMWAEIETAEPTQDMFFYIYDASIFVTQGEQAVFNDLVSYVSPKTQLLTAESGELYVMCAVIMDYKGNYSPMWVSDPFTYTYSAETKKPLDELVEKLGISEPEPQASTLKLMSLK